MEAVFPLWDSAHMKKPSKPKLENPEIAELTDQVLTVRAELLRSAIRVRLDTEGLSAITAALRAGLNRDAIRNFLGPKKTNLPLTVEPSIFKIADVAAVLGCTVDELLTKGNEIRDKELGGLFPDLSNKKDTSPRHSVRDVNKGEDLMSDKMLEHIVEAWPRMNKVQRYDLMEKLFELTGGDKARFLEG